MYTVFHYCIGWLLVMITLTITTIFVEVIKDFTDGWAEDKNRKKELNGEQK